MVLTPEKLAQLAQFPALRRSLATYYGDAERDAAMDALHRRYLKAGDLAFDIGAHVGDRIGSFRRIGARVVALEPQPDCAEAIRILYAGDAGLTLLEQACGAAPGRLTMRVNTQNPTVSTLSGAFIDAAQDADGWREQVWDRTIEVRVTTLDRLIANHGTPAFCKIDVEGHELAALEGLTRSIPALSFEFTTIQRDIATACIARLRDLGRYKFDLSLGENHQLAFGAPVSAAEIAAQIAALPHAANSGDVYATLTP